jgi:hypothetical protein
MKRLIKAEIYDGFNDEYHDNGYVEVFKNPTDSEIREILKQSNDNSIRGVIYNDGTIIAWPGDIIHDCINKEVSKQIEVNDCFRFAKESSSWFIDCHGKYTLQEAIDLVGKYSDTLSRFGNLDTKWEFVFTKDDKSIDIYYSEMKKSASIIINPIVPPQPSNNDNEIIKDLRKPKQNIPDEPNFQQILDDEIKKRSEGRLIKKSEIYDGLNYYSNYYEVYKNPSDKEIGEIRKQSPTGSIRGLIYDNGDTYIWPGEILHN